MGIKTIKGVDEKTWQMMKQMARKKRKKMSEILSFLVKKHYETNRKGWNLIKKGPKILSEQEAKKLLKISKTLRKETGLRF